MKPIVTIGICVRNSEKMITNALNSIIGQDFPHKKMEVIIVDDGSEDSTLQIIKNHTSKMDIQTKVFRTHWKGTGSARNLIISKAEGDFLIWVDADEIISEGYVRQQVDFMQKNSTVGITTGIVKEVPNNIILNLELIPSMIGHLNFEKPKNLIWKTEKLPGTGGATHRVMALKQVNGFNEAFTGAGEDQDVAQRIRAAGWLIKLNNAPFYELHGGMSTFKDLWKKYIWYGHGCQKIYSRNRTIFSFPRMSPLAGIVTGLFYALASYKVMHEKKLFLLPIHYGFKMTAWMIGFFRGQVSAYFSSS